MQLFDGRVELLGQLLVLFAKDDDVVPRGQRLADKLELRLEIGVSLGVLQGDRQIEEHGVDLLLLQVFVRRGLVVVGAHLDALLVEQAGLRPYWPACPQPRLPSCSRPATGNGCRRGGRPIAACRCNRAAKGGIAAWRSGVSSTPFMAKSKSPRTSPESSLGNEYCLNSIGRPISRCRASRSSTSKPTYWPGWFGSIGNVGRPAFRIAGPEQRLFRRRRIGRLGQIPPEKCQQDQPASPSHSDATFHANRSPFQRRPEGAAKKRKNGTT